MRECVGNGRDLALFGGGPCLSDTTLLLTTLSAKSKKLRVDLITGLTDGTSN